MDYTPRIPASVTFAAGQSEASFSIRAIPDGKRETGEGLRLDFGPLPSGVRKGAWGPYETIAFVDQVLPEYTAGFGAEAYTATEGGDDARVSIHLNEPVEIEPLEVRLSVQRGGGATVEDYAGIPARVTFDVGDQTQTITVVATDDADDDGGERVTLSFVEDPTDRVSTGNGPSAATVALEDNDGAEQVTVSFGAATYTATEGGDDATVRVELDAAPGRTVTIPLTTAGGGGATTADYSVNPERVTFGANVTAKTVTVTATADSDLPWCTTRDLGQQLPSTPRSEVPHDEFQAHPAEVRPEGLPCPELAGVRDGSPRSRESDRLARTHRWHARQLELAEADAQEARPTTQVLEPRHRDDGHLGLGVWPGVQAD